MSGGSIESEKSGRALDPIGRSGRMTPDLVGARHWALETSVPSRAVEQFYRSLRDLAEQCDGLAESGEGSSPAHQLLEASHCLHQALAVLHDVPDRRERV